MTKYWEIGNWTEMYVFAKKHAITGQVMGEIEKMKGSSSPKISKNVLLQWIKDTEQIKRQNLLVNRAVEALSILLNVNDIRYAVVKGQIAASYYERPELRMSGDVDFYVYSGDLEKAKTIICKEWGVEIEEENSPYHYHFEYCGVIFEMHFRLFLWYHKKKEEYWNNILYEAMGYGVKIGSTKVATLKPTVHTLYVFMHLYHHLVEVGVGLRQFFDLAMFLKEKIDRELLVKYLKEFELEKAFKACGYILINYVGMDKKYMPYEIGSVDRKYGRRMLDVVLFRGNMGHYNKRNGWSGIGHQVESACIKISHFVKFFWLSPGYHLGWIRSRIVSLSN